MILAQPVNPRGLSPSFGLQNPPCCLGQHVVDPGHAARMAILSGTMGDLRLIMLATAVVYGAIEAELPQAPAISRALFTARRGQAKDIADEISAFSIISPAYDLFESRADEIAGLVVLAQSSAEQFSEYPKAVDALGKLFSTASDVQSRIEAATRPSPDRHEAKRASFIVPAMLTGALVAVLGTAFYLSRR